MFVPKMPKKVLLVTTSPAGLSGPGVTVNVLKQHMESSKKYVAEVVSFNGGGVAQEGVVGDIKKAILEEIVGSRKVPRYGFVE